MGYSLWFGEFAVDSDPEERWATATARWPEGMQWPADAPYDSCGADSTDSCISPSYIGWADFCDRHGLDDVFFGERRGDGSRKGWWGPEGDEQEILIRHHPGAAPLTETCLDRFELAQRRHSLDHLTYEKAAEKLRAWLELPYEKRKGWGPGNIELDTEVWDALRLNWLSYWTAYTLRTCEYPTFANS